MKDVASLVSHLSGIGAMSVGGSPWPSRPSDESCSRVDWDRIFPPRTRSEVPVDAESGLPVWDDSPFELAVDVVDEINSLIGKGDEGVNLNPEDGRGSGGWDTCAWYQPIHFFGADWGIFIKESCVLRAAADISRFFWRPVPTHLRKVYANACIRAAVYVYFLHEHYHHKIECLGIRLEVASAQPFYAPYFRRVYSPSLGTDHVLEESLANADAFRRLREPRYLRSISVGVTEATQRYLSARFPSAPPGYRKAVDFLTDKKFDDGENLLQAQFVEATTIPGRPVWIWSFAPRMTQSMFTVESNIWAIVSASSAPVLPRRL